MILTAESANSISIQRGLPSLLVCNRLNECIHESTVQYTCITLYMCTCMLRIPKWEETTTYGHVHVQ